MLDFIKPNTVWKEVAKEFELNNKIWKPDDSGERF